MARLQKSTFNLNKHLVDVLHRPPLGPPPKAIDIWQLPSMAAAAAAVPRRLAFWPTRGQHKDTCLASARRATTPDALRLATALEDSDSLIAEAIAADPRLARRSQWTRGEEGEVVCPALLSQGDDAPCFYRQRSLVGQPNGAEPVKVVISTDASDIRPRTAAAFIATCRLVQQYRPLEVYWQGSWLGEGRTTGWVFHVPLIAGDMDYARLEFCIADDHRDTLSWAVMMVRAIDHTHSIWNGCSLQAERSYLPGAHFVSHHGVYPDGDSIAATACEWLGWESLYRRKWAEEDAVKAALQELPSPTIVPRARKPEEQAEDTKRWQEYETRRREQERKDAASRQEKVGAHTYT